MSLRQIIPPPPPALGHWGVDVRDAMALPAVRAPVLENGWTDYGQPYGPAGFFKRQGMVRLTGVVAGGAGGQAILTLPGGFRPGVTVRFAVDADGAHGAVEVGTDGRVTAVAGGNTRLTLDGITFRAGG